MSRLLGIDLGERRIGLAIAEPGLEPARPLSTLSRASDAAQDVVHLATVIRDQRITELVVGLPINADGSEGPMAIAARTWAAAIEGELGLPVHLRDERLSSHLAEDRLGPMPRGRSGGAPTRTQRDRYRAQVDRAAAAIILQDELDARASSRAGGDA
ncbi:MAG: Holliday junction resolvase RuvX [Candidatus Limnocylindrales bacterium]